MSQVLLCTERIKFIIYPIVYFFVYFVLFVFLLLLSNLDIGYLLTEYSDNCSGIKNLISTKQENL